jgi:hypothetical protein
MPCRPSSASRRSCATSLTGSPRCAASCCRPSQTHSAALNPTCLGRTFSSPLRGLPIWLSVDASQQRWSTTVNIFHASLGDEVCLLYRSSWMQEDLAGKEGKLREGHVELFSTSQIFLRG